MGGGEDSRIPGILTSLLPEMRIVIRTYDFDPQLASEQIASWVDEVKPSVVIGESMGAVHAIAIKGVPHILVSPSLNAAVYFHHLAPLTRIPGVTGLLDRKFHPKKGRRQALHFTYDRLRKWDKYRERAYANSTASGGTDYFHAFFGTKDHFRRSGVVMVSTWRKWFGDGSYDIYDGSHFMEEQYIRTMLIPEIRKVSSAFSGSGAEN